MYFIKNNIEIAVNLRLALMYLYYIVSTALVTQQKPGFQHFPGFGSHGVPTFQSLVNTSSNMSTIFELFITTNMSRLTELFDLA